MPIQSGDIKLYKSDTMDDTANGGGLITNQEVVDGVSNNVFDDIPTLSRTFGDVNMRKLFPAIDIQTQDKYLGSHVIISKLPGDTQLGVNLFSTDDHYDRREAAQKRVENYKAVGANYGGFLFATQFKDSKVITIFQDKTVGLPGVGDVLYLSQNGDIENQFVKIVTIAIETRTFTDAQGSFEREILTVEISQGLDFDFVGSQISRFDTVTPAATIKETVVANAAKYYSARPLSVAGAVNDLSVKVDTIYSQVIPSSLQELAVLNVNAAGESTSILDIGADNLSFPFNNNDIIPLTNIFLGRACTPSTLQITVTGGVIFDDGGQLKIGSNTIGTINYSAGTLSFSATSPIYTGDKTITFKPAVPPILATSSAALDVTPSNRGFVWAITLDPKPLRTSLRVQFSALGEWFTLFDNGSGGLSGLENGIGSGTIDYDTGVTSITLAALPDADTQILFTWTEKTQTIPFDIVVGAASLNVSLPNLNTKTPSLSTLAVTWNDGAARTANSDTLGNLSGDATGFINIFSNTATISPNTLPAEGTVFGVTYNEVDSHVQLLAIQTPDVVTGNIVIDLGVTNITPGSLRVNIFFEPDSSWYNSTYRLTNNSLSQLGVILSDDGVGNIVTGNESTGRKPLDPLIFGTLNTPSINYATGILTLPNELSFGVFVSVLETVTTGTRREPSGFGFTIVNETKEVITGKTLTTLPYKYSTNNSIGIRFDENTNSVAVNTSGTPSILSYTMERKTADQIVEGSVILDLGGEIFTETGGIINKEIDHELGTLVPVGTFDYSTGVVNFTSWTTGITNILTTKGGTEDNDFKAVSSILTRVPSAPVKPLSFQFTVDTVDTEIIDNTVFPPVTTGVPAVTLSATSDATGFIVSPNINGFIDYDSGVVNINFHETGDTNTKIKIDGSTMRYNAVSQTFLPLDENILGLNPVRLPSDGRIPIYETGDVVVILHDGNTTATFTSNTTTVIGRSRQSKITVRDVGNNLIDPSFYTADLDIGEVTWGDLTGLSQPLTIIDRIEDMAVVSDVQITGTLTITKPLSHVFPVTETLVSSAIIQGDLFATTTPPFDQQTFTGVWSDTLIGNDTIANFNNVLYPILVDNRSSLEERWALIFTSTTLVNIIGEHVGQILTGASIVGNIAPVNPVTGFPYFTIDSNAWGAGWSAGNVLRFNTISATFPIWVIQSVGQGDATSTDLEVCFEIRGDIDTP
jgi:hypothetical protein